jgi:hypothetical protein
MHDLLARLNSKEGRVRLGASKTLREISRLEPGRVYPHFDVFAALLNHPNHILQWNAIQTLAHLARVDRDGKLEAILDTYLAAIDGPVLITAANTIQGAARIAQAKPHLAGRIAKAILHVEKARYATPECRNVAIGHAVEALAKLAPLLPDPRRVCTFAARHSGNQRPATARKAQRCAAALQSA